jgi:hypothetical protein
MCSLVDVRRGWMGARVVWVGLRGPPPSLGDLKLFYPLWSLRFQCHLRSSILHRTSHYECLFLCYVCFGVQRFGYVISFVSFVLRILLGMHR